MPGHTPDRPGHRVANYLAPDLQPIPRFAGGYALSRRRGSGGDGRMVCQAKPRRELEPESSRPRYLLTESGMGYQFWL
jgi:hypothetical protein